jgi:processing peptidase subunit beta
VEEERSTILREGEEVAKNEEEVLMDHLHSVAFQRCSLAYTILGPQQNIKRLTSQDLKDYVKTYYTGNRIVLAAAGGVNHDKLVDMAKKSLGHLPQGNPAGYPEVSYTGSLVEVRDDSKPYAHVAVAMQGPGNSDANAHIVHLIQALTGFYDRNIGAGHATNSELTELVVEGKLAHRLSSFSTLYRNVGLFGVTGVTDPHNLEEFVANIFIAWKKNWSTYHVGRVGES